MARDYRNRTRCVGVEGTPLATWRNDLHGSSHAHVVGCPTRVRYFLLRDCHRRLPFPLRNIELFVSSDHSNEQIDTLFAPTLPSIGRVPVSVISMLETLAWREQIDLRPSLYFEAMVEVGAQSPAKRGAPVPMSDSSVGVGRSSHRAHGISARREARATLQIASNGSSDIPG